jgi:WD40 repeat protein
VFDAQTGQELLSFKGHTARINSVAFSPDGKRVASSSINETVKVWDPRTGQELLTLKGGSLVAYSPDGKRLVSIRGFGPLFGILPSSGGGPAPGEAKVWDAQTGREFFSLKLPPVVGRMVFSPDGKRLANASGGFAGPQGGPIKVWDAQTGQELLALKDGGVNVSFSPDGKRLASTSLERTVKVWDAQTGKELFIFQGGGHNVAFSPEGRRLASADGERLKVWDMHTGEELLTLKMHTGGLGNVFFSPDGHRLAGVGWDGPVTIWDATPLPQKP